MKIVKYLSQYGLYMFEILCHRCGQKFYYNWEYYYKKMKYENVRCHLCGCLQKWEELERDHNIINNLDVYLEISKKE